MIGFEIDKERITKIEMMRKPSALRAPPLIKGGFVLIKLMFFIKYEIKYMAMEMMAAMIPDLDLVKRRQR